MAAYLRTIAACTRGSFVALGLLSRSCLASAQGTLAASSTNTQRSRLSAQQLRGYTPSRGRPKRADPDDLPRDLWRTRLRLLGEDGEPLQAERPEPPPASPSSSKNTIADPLYSHSLVHFRYRDVDYHLMGLYSAGFSIALANMALQRLKPNQVVVGIDEMPRPEHWLTIELLQPLGFYPESNVNCWRSLVGAASIALRQDIPLVFADRPFETTKSRIAQLDRKTADKATELLSESAFIRLPMQSPMAAVELVRREQNLQHTDHPALQLCNMFERDLLFIEALKEQRGPTVLGLFSKQSLYGILEQWFMPLEREYVQQLKTPDQGLATSIQLFTSMVDARSEPSRSNSTTKTDTTDTEGTSASATSEQASSASSASSTSG